MAYRVPDDETVAATCRAVLRDAQSIVSQRELCVQVTRGLHRIDPGFHVSEERVRRLAARQKFVRVELRARKGSREKVLTKCPVCESRLERVKNQTLFGGEVTLTLRCPECNYWTGKEKRVPTLYVFHYAGSPNGPREAPELARRDAKAF